MQRRKFLGVLGLGAGAVATRQGLAEAAPGAPESPQIADLDKGLPPLPARQHPTVLIEGGVLDMGDPNLVKRFERALDQFSKGNPGMVRRKTTG